MPDLPEFGGVAGLQALEAAARDARSVLRRMERLAEQPAIHQDPGLDQLLREMVEAGERLVAGLEERRAQERLRLRSRLRPQSDQEPA
ncbi:MAG: hypothetical protein ACYDD0_08825 [Candidatus Dormibacteria bacterium]